MHSHINNKQFRRKYSFVKVDLRATDSILAARNGAQLHEAAAKGDLILLQSLLRLGVSVDVTVPGNPNTPLLEAYAKGQLETAKVLLAAGADVRKQTKDGRTALHLAASAGSLPLVELLAKTSIDLNARDSLNKTAADDAVAARSLPVLSFLLERGGSPVDRKKALELAIDTNNRALAERLISAAPTITAGDFLIAVRFGLSDLAHKYLDADNKPPALALLLAAYNGHLSLCELLLDKGANPNGDPDDNSVITPLVAALRERHPEAARLLLARGADPGIAQGGSSSPASLARSAGYDDIAKTIDDTIRIRASRVQQRLQSLRRLRLSVSVPRMLKMTSRGNDRITQIDLDKAPTDEHWTPLVRRAVEDAVSSFGVILVEAGQDADLNVTFQGYSAFSPSPFQLTSEVLLSAMVMLNAPELGPLHKYTWTVPFLSRQDVNNYSKYFSSKGEVNETAVLTAFRDEVKVDLAGVLPPPATKASPSPNVGASSPAKAPTPRKELAPGPARRK